MSTRDSDTHRRYARGASLLVNSRHEIEFEIHCSGIESGPLLLSSEQPVRNYNGAAVVRSEVRRQCMRKVVAREPDKRQKKRSTNRQRWKARQASLRRKCPPPTEKQGTLQFSGKLLQAISFEIAENGSVLTVDIPPRGELPTGRGLREANDDCIALARNCC